MFTWRNASSVSGSRLTVRYAHPTRLRVLSILSLVCSVALCALALTALSVNELVVLSNWHNVYGIAPSPTTPPTPLIPQIDATIGHLRFCIGAHCVFRAQVHGAWRLLMPVDEAAAWLPTDKLKTLYQRAHDQFFFGYDAAVPCGGSVAEVRALTLLFFSVTLITAASTAVGGVVSIVLQTIMSRVDVLRGLRYHNNDDNEAEGGTLIGIKQEDAEYFRLQTVLRLRVEVPLAVTVCVCSALSLALSVCGVVGVQVLVLRSMRCGTDICTAFSTAMDGLFEELRRQHGLAHDSAALDYRATCSLGTTTKLSIGIVAVSAVLFMSSVLFLVLYATTGRTAQLRRRRDALNSFTGVFLAPQHGKLESRSVTSRNSETLFAQEKMILASAHSVSPLTPQRTCHGIEPDEVPADTGVAGSAEVSACGTRRSSGSGTRHATLNLPSSKWGEGGSGRVPPPSAMDKPPVTTSGDTVAQTKCSLVRRSESRDTSQRGSALTQASLRTPPNAALRASTEDSVPPPPPPLRSNEANSLSIKSVHDGLSEASTRSRNVAQKVKSSHYLSAAVANRGLGEASEQTRDTKEANVTGTPAVCMLSGTAAESRAERGTPTSVTNPLAQPPAQDADTQAPPTALCVAEADGRAEV